MISGRDSYGCDGGFEFNIGNNQEHLKEDPKPLFDSGQVVGTPGALEALVKADQNPFELLHRHALEL